MFIYEKIRGYFETYPHNPDGLMLEPLQDRELSFFAHQLCDEISSAIAEPGEAYEHDATTGEPFSYECEYGNYDFERAYEILSEVKMWINIRTEADKFDIYGEDKDVKISVNKTLLLQALCRVLETEIEIRERGF